MKQNQVFRRLLSLAAALALLLSLCSAPGLAAEEEAEIEIVWLSGATSEYQYFIYIQELGWVCCETYSENGYPVYAVYDVSTGARIEEFDAVGIFTEGLALVAKEDADGNEKCGFIDTSGKTIVPLEYDSAEPFSEGLALVMKYDADGNWKYGFIDKTGKVVVPLEYDYADSISEGLAWVGKRDTDWNRKYGFIDKSGKTVVPLEYDSVGSYSEGLAAVAKKDADGKQKFGFIDKTGKVVVPLEYDYAPFFFEGLAEVAKEGKYGFIDKSGKLVIPMEYDDAAPFSEGLARVGKRDADGNEKYGFIDKSGKAVIPLEYNGAGFFSEGLAWVVKMDADGNRKRGFIDKSGKIVVPLEYDYAEPFSEGLARVVKKDADGNWRCGFIDRTGKAIVPLEFDDDGYVTNAYGYSSSCFINDNGYVTYYGDNYYEFKMVHDKITELRWVKKGLSYGVFKNPYYTPAASGSGETNEPSAGNAQTAAPSPAKTPGNGKSTPDAAPTGQSKSSGLTPVLAIIFVVAVAAVILLLILLLRKKKPSAAVAPSVSAFPAPQFPKAQSAASQTSAAPAAKELFCPFCGCRAEPGATYCPSCGRELPNR